MQQILGDYKLLKQIGQGTLGTTYLSEHRFLKRQFVVKVLPPEFTKDRGFIQRFEEEVSLLAALDHPHIVKIHNISFAEGVYFIVMDCILDSIGGITHLGHYMQGRKERLKEEELLKLLKQVAAALDYAHKKSFPTSKEGIVHRNLKLSNIIIGHGKAGLDVFVSDFGLTKLIGTGLVISRTYKAMADSLALSTTDLQSKSQDNKYSILPFDSGKISQLNESFLQNYNFLAPEQKFIDEKKMLDGRTDTYAFGVLIYYLITGRFPEGNFSKPLEIASEYRYDWNKIVDECLHDKVEKRPLELTPLLISMTAAHINSVHQEKIEEKRPSIENTVSLEPKVNLESKEIRDFIQAKIDELHKEVAIAAAVMPQAQAFVHPQTPPPIPSSAIKPQNIQEEFVAVTAQTEPTVFENISIQPAIHAASASVLMTESVKIYEPEALDPLLITPLLTETKKIPGGSYLRGSNEGNRDEMPRHTIHIHDFAIDIHPVTNEQFVRYLEYMGGEKDSNFHDIIRLKDSRIKRAAGKLSIESGYSKHPVVGVTWYGAVGYAQWIGKRLPTEAEWEISSRGGLEVCTFPTGDVIEKTQANFFSSDTTPVMSYQPNGYGLYDMAGNVYEWCQDWYGYNYYESSALEPNQPKGPLQGVYRVLRGGCWKSLKDDLRSSHRHRNNPGAVNGTYGFRCANDV